MSVIAIKELKVLPGSLKRGPSQHECDSNKRVESTTWQPQEGTKPA